MNPNLHHVPGRLRVRSPRLKRNARLAETARRELGLVAGITGVRVTEVTGSITLTYDVGTLGKQDLLELLLARGWITADLLAEPASPGLAARALDLSAARAGEVLAKATVALLVEKAIERSTIALIAAVA
jgi:hypothetical protein